MEYARRKAGNVFSTRRILSIILEEIALELQGLVKPGRVLSHP